MKIRFYIWLTDWARILDGTIGVLSLGFIHKNYSMRMAAKLARARMNLDKENFLCHRDKS